jgi:hypothetical protein
MQEGQPEPELYKLADPTIVFIAVDPNTLPRKLLPTLNAGIAIGQRAWKVE